VHIYVLSTKVLRWNFIKISLLPIRSGCTNFSADFWSFRNFRPQFRKNCGAT